jgi:uncharacterized membrane protein
MNTEELQKTTSLPTEKTKLPDKHRSLGDLAADKMAQGYGSWYFLFGQLLLIAVWIVFNVYSLTEGKHFDPFPFILLNLAMSAQATFAAPVILMSSNRSADYALERNEAILGQIQEILDSQTEIMERQGENLHKQDKVLAKQDAELAKIGSVVEQTPDNTKS